MTKIINLARYKKYHGCYDGNSCGLRSARCIYYLPLNLDSVSFRRGSVFSHQTLLEEREEGKFRG
jgi:hypothetical protein